MIVSCEMPYISTSGSVNVETGKQPMTKPKPWFIWVLCQILKPSRLYYHITQGKTPGLNH